MKLTSLLRVASAAFFFALTGSALAQTGGLLSQGQVLGNFSASTGPSKPTNLITFPVVSGNLPCFTGTTGLLQDCAVAPAAFLRGANNLSDLANVATARTNLGLNPGIGLATSGGSLNLQPASAGVIGGVNSIAPVAHQWINSISTAGLPSLSQPTFADISGGGGTTNGVVYNAGSGLGNTNSTINGLLVTSGAGVPSISTTIPAGLTFAGTENFLGTVAIAPSTGTTQGLSIIQTGPSSGSVAGVASACWGSGQPSFLYNSICISGDASNPTGGNPSYTYGLNVGMQTGQINSTGTKVTLGVTMAHNGGGSIQTFNRDHIGFQSIGLANVSEGGTNTGAGALGTIFAENPGTACQSGATNMFECASMEVDTGIYNGASSKYRFGISNVDNGDIQATSLDAAYTIGSTSTSPGWGIGWLLTNAHGGHAPISLGGCVICGDGSANTVGSFADLSTWNFTSQIFNFKNFNVTGGGLLTANNFIDSSTVVAGTAGFQFSDSTVNAVYLASTAFFGNSALIGTLTNHPLVFQTNNLPRGSISAAGVWNIGLTGTLGGQMGFSGATSGTATIIAPAVAGNPTLTLPTTTGVFANNAASPLFLAATGVMSCPGCLTNTPAALTKTDDTNVTLTLGGTPATALLQATSLTLGWTGTLAAGRLNSNVVQSIVNDTNVTGSISAQALTLAWSGQLSVARGGTGIASGTSGGIPYFSGTGSIASSALLTANAIVLGGGAATAPAVLASLGTTATVLHGNASGAPTFGAVVSADMNITTTSCTNQFVTAISAGGVGTCTTDTLASAQHANQGTTTTVLHGNAAGNPSFAAVSLTADITGILTGTNGGTGVNNGSNTFTSGGNVAFSGAFATTITATATTNSTLPAGTHTLGGLDVAQTWLPGSGSNTFSSSNNYSLIVRGATSATNNYILLDTQAATQQAGIYMADAGNLKWLFAKNSDQTFSFFDGVNSINSMKVTAGVVTAGKVEIGYTTASTSTVTGSLLNPGGFGNGGAIYGGAEIATGAVAVASLPTCNSAHKAARHFVTDSNAVSYTAGIGSVVAAGGSTNVPVTCDGTNWRIGANDNFETQMRKFA